MALQNNDRFLVSRGGVNYRVTFEEINEDAVQAIADAASAQTDANAAQATANTALNAAQNSFQTTGGTLTGALVNTERTIGTNSFDLSQGNMWTCGAITVPNPTNANNGQSGLIRITSGPVIWGANFKFPGGSAPTISTFPSIIPYYVQSSSVILMGTVTEGIV